jgi:AcrR family transcriptional regulator
MTKSGARDVVPKPLLGPCSGGGYPGRRRGASATREAILESARRRFADEGYERAGVRAIAADAGVTAALVNRYFGSKEALFAEVIGLNLCLGELIGEDRAVLAERLARKMVYGWEGCEDDNTDLTPLQLLLRSATEERAAELLRENLDGRASRILADIIGGPDALARAALVLSQMIGFGTMNKMIKTEALAGADRERLYLLLKANLDACIG